MHAEVKRILIVLACVVGWSLVIVIDLRELRDWFLQGNPAVFEHLPSVAFPILATIMSFGTNYSCAKVDMTTA